jgi:N-acetylated-alpha-linked acidic dipeptidase
MHISIYVIHALPFSLIKIVPSSPELTQAEKIMLDLPSSQNLRESLKLYTSEAHLAGTSTDKKQAEWTRDQFESFGLETKIDTYWPLLNYPISHRLALVSGPEDLRFEAKLTEDPVDEDETSKDPNVVPTFHGYSKNGTVQGRIVYANYGRLEDFQFLKDQGVELNGTIALMRYGGNFRGLKVRVAELFGCAGALIYSDPIDDGPLNKDNSSNPAESYPNGPWRSKSSAQRGSVQYLSLLAGDPLTPGYAATENATRIKPEDSPGLAKIPSLPLSWEDALPILKATQGLGVRGKNDWAGGLDEVAYFSGPTEGEAILVNHIENKITPIWNVISRIEGAEEPDKAIILGNHRDAWVYGGVDPSSGSASLLELARVFGELLKTGWRPRRTIVLASWDAEEYGLVGSTEWVEDNKEWLDKEAAVYINVDVAVSGSHFGAQASPSLNKLLYSVVSDIHDPRTGKSVFEAWRSDQKLTEGKTPKILRLGSGSDFVPFLDHMGIASINMGFAGDYGVYHSNYDSFHWMEKFGDPGFLYHETLVKLWGLLALRLSDSIILPLYPSDYSAEIAIYAGEIADLASSHISFPELENAIRKLQRTTCHIEKEIQDLKISLSKYNSLDDIPSALAKQLATINNRLAFFERGFIDPEGIKDRDWFKHVIFAPGLWTGYASQIFPAIADGIEGNDLKQARYAEKRAAWAIGQAVKCLNEKY